jgi:methylenetetrahydrofolate reductase (NADPH)
MDTQIIHYKQSNAGGTVAAAASKGQRNIRVSFEFFPISTPEAETASWAAIQRLAPLNPSFVSVTYGAGGSTRERTHRTVQRILDETALTPAAHLTCVGAHRDEIDDVLQQYWDCGVRHIVALRGDPPGAFGAIYTPRPDDYPHATALVAAARRVGDFEVSVGVYPEKHPESPSFEHDIAVLKAKVDAGATRAITQFCFDRSALLRLRDRAYAAGITIPIIPGIMPVSNFKGLTRMAAACQTTIPPWLFALFDGLDHDPETRRLLAASVATEQVAQLEHDGFQDFHFYTLNRADLVYAICRVLGVHNAMVEPA